jgi:hypothetical protein
MRTLRLKESLCFRIRTQLLPPLIWPRPELTFESFGFDALKLKYPFSEVPFVFPPIRLISATSEYPAAGRLQDAI